MKLEKVKSLSLAKSNNGETIKNVPNTLASQSMILYGIGGVVTLFGIGLIYKHVKQI